MRTTTSFPQIREDIKTVWNRSGQVIHELTELGLELGSLESVAAQLAERSRNYAPRPARDGVYTVDPTAEGDPREVLGVLKERLRRTLENLERASDLLSDRRAAIERIIG